MAVRLAALVRQPDTLYLSLDAHLPPDEQREYRCMPLTCLGGELIERMRAGHKPGLVEIRAVVGAHLPELAAADVARLGPEELLLVLHHAAGTDVEELVNALLAATGAEVEDTSGKAATRQTAQAGRTARAGRATTSTRQQPTRAKAGRARSAKR